MRIVIPGGAGFVGRNLVRVMAEDGVQLKDVVVIDKDAHWLDYVKSFGANVVEGDCAVVGDWMSAFKGADVVINLAAQISSREKQPFIENNVTATQLVLDAMRKHKVKRILHFSSAAVLSVRKDDYAATKQQGEDIVTKSGFDWVVLRPSIMYGPTDTKNIGWLINFARKLPFFPIPGHGRYPRQPIYIDDVCRLILAMLGKFPKGKTYSINGRETIYFRDMIKTVLKAMGGWRFRLFIPVWLFRFAMVVGNKVLPRAPFTPDQLDSLTSGDVFPDYPWWDEFGIKVTSFDEGVRRMLSSTPAASSSASPTRS